jgi:hypothetical protein
MRDVDIRRKLQVDKRLHFGDPNTRIIQELGLCQGIARVDIAVVNGNIHGYEIKSDRDTLARLPGQIDIYNRVLDFVTVVIERAHADRIKTIVPPWWGIWTAIENGQEDLRLNILRTHRPNPAVSPFALAQLLWREEALEALNHCGLANGVRSKPRQELWRRLASLPLEDLGNIVRDRLKRRGANWRPAPPPS